MRHNLQVVGLYPAMDLLDVGYEGLDATLQER